MTFDGQAEQVQVIGKGRMFIEDRRPASPQAEGQAEAQAKSEAPANKPALGVHFGGRGQTLFLWSKLLTLDAAKNDVHMKGTVQMVHRPAGAQTVVQLDSQRLFADLKDTGGLGRWMDQQAPQADVQLIRADDTVRVVNGNRTVHADHLQYTEADQLVRLWADDNHMVRIERSDQPTGFSFKAGTWNLRTDKFDAHDLGSSVVPIPE